MPPIMKFQAFFASGEGNGWTEVHYHNSTSDPPPIQQWHDAFKTNVLGPRAILLGEDCSLVGARVSFPRANALASYGTRFKFSGTAGQNTVEPSDSLATIFKDSTFTKTKVTHLRGFWDLVIHDGAYQPGLGGAVWNDAFTAWKDALIQGGYGWLSKDPANSVTATVVSYTSDAEGFVTFTLDPDLQVFPAPLIKTIQVIRFSKLNNSKSPLNKPLICSVDSATTLRTVYPVAAGPFTAKGKANYRAVAFTQYASTATIELGERRMGKPLARYPGRRSKVAKY